MRVNIQGNSYTLLADWSDISLAKFQELCSIPIPKKLQAKWTAWLEEKDAEPDDYKDIIKNYPRYYGKVIQCLSDIPKDVIDRIEWSLRDQLFTDYLFKYAVSVFTMPQYETIFPESFKFKGEEYFLPESLMRGGKRIPMIKESVVTFSEAADIEIAVREWGERGIDAMAQVCAVYLRKKGEEHSDELVESRTEQFKELPMSVVWEVFFCIVTLGMKLQLDLLTYSKEAMENLIQQQQSLESEVSA